MGKSAETPSATLTSRLQVTFKQLPSEFLERVKGIEPSS